jgi:hypothetical protein
MQNIRKTWYRMSAKSLHNHMTQKLQLPTDVAVDICKQVHAAKEAQRKQRIKISHVYNGWQTLIASAVAEQQNVRVLKSQTKALGGEGTDKWQALCTYEECIKACIDRLRRVQEAGEHTPMQFVEFLRETTGRVIPNGGLFWTDYIKVQERRALEAQFAALPAPVRGRRKVPFERRLPRHIHAAQRSALHTQLDEAQKRLTQAIDMKPDSFTLDELEADLRKVHQARYELDRTPKNAVLPNRWQALLK